MITIDRFHSQILCICFFAETPLRGLNRHLIEPGAKLSRVVTQQLHSATMAADKSLVRGSRWRCGEVAMLCGALTRALATRMCCHR